MEQLYKETAIVSENMQKYGGTFAQRLGSALGHADINNIMKIKNTWSDLWNTYLNWGNNDGK